MGILWKGAVSAQLWANRGNFAFPQNSHTRKLGEITVFFATVKQNELSRNKENLGFEICLKF